MPRFPARSAYVGRETELQRLREAFDTAAVGEGTIAFVVGEPGIGKTALCEQLGTYVARCTHWPAPSNSALRDGPARVSEPRPCLEPRPGVTRDPGAGRR